MKATEIPFCDTNSFSKLIVDYLDQDSNLTPFYNHYPSLEAFGPAAKNKTYSNDQRALLVERLKSQYKVAGIKIAESTEEQIDSLAEENTSTITTGHQLSLFGGPLYFIYKIISVIKLSRELNKRYTDLHFVPLFWMATEDHDFDEVNHFYYKGSKLQWNRESGNAVGRLDNAGLEGIFNELKELLPDFSSHASWILSLFEKAYIKTDNYASACRVLVHELFAEEGLLILDGDDVELKKSFAPMMQEELTKFSTQENVEKQSAELGKAYKLQVNPRQINLFYLSDSRERIEKTVSGYNLVDSKKEFRDEELLSELSEHPEHFSPNVILRPLYQEYILPNLAYIGGGGELAYWMQLKSNFEHFKVDFPMLVLRNSVAYISKKKAEEITELGVGLQDLFQEEGVMIKSWVKKQQTEESQIDNAKQAFQDLWNQLKKKSLEEDASLGPHVEAQEVRLQKWMDQLSDKLIRSQRRKHQKEVDLIKAAKAELFPNGSLQERRESMIELLLWKGKDLIPELIELFETPTENFIVLETE